MSYRYIVGEGWVGGKEPPANLCKVIGANMDHRTLPTYDFTDVHGTGTPVRIHGKRQWREHLKRNGLTDDIHWTDAKKPIRKEMSASDQRQISQAIDRAITEVSKRPYSCIGKQVSHDQLRREFSQLRQRQERRS